MTYLQALIIAIVEGLTEFLPVSSTGHMVITSSLMRLEGDFVALFEIAIQFGAILSVVALYWRRFLNIDLKFYSKLVVGFLPAALFGVLLYKQVKAMLSSPTLIAVILLLGGIILLFVDKWFPEKETKTAETVDIDYKKAAIIGSFQVLAMILPGLSRSAATIIGGLTQKLSRAQAAEFSFFLAVPTMAAATAKDALEYYTKVKEGALPTLTTDEIGILAMGNIVAFVVAFLAMRSFVGYLAKHGFKVFGYYRIIVGLLILILQAAGFQLFAH